jgi:DNA-binding transcriptional ArsR family regulator
MKAATEIASAEAHINLIEVAMRLESLGNATRLSIYQLLVKAGALGLPVGEIQRRLDIPGSTLSHHLASLVQHELVTQVREGRVHRCKPNFKTMSELLEFLTHECCQDLGECRTDMCEGT